MAILLATGGATSPVHAIDLQLAARYFQEAKWASDDDGGKLWGKPLYGPMLFADPQTREVVANQRDRQGKLHKAGSLWVGELAKEVGIANTATEWGGVKWTMVMWGALGGPQAIRVQLMMHECWHRIQADVGLPAPDTQQRNVHLDTETGRIWLRLEWRALSAALVGIGDERTRAITDALIFRAHRRELIPGAAAQEDRMEVHEGLAEYTGVRLMGLGDWSRGAYLAGRVKMNAVSRPSYPMSFAYETGPCYGILLDDTGKEWRSKLTPASSLSESLREAAGIKLPADIEAAARERAAAYDGQALIAEEDNREETRKAAEAKWRALLVEGPTLELPIPQGNFSYDPNAVFPLGEDGTVYPETRIADDWGVVEVKNGARVVWAKHTAFVAAPSEPDKLSNANWVLTLKPGWRLVPGERKGDFKLAPAGPTTRRSSG
jgi:hypothetical protein